MMCVSSEKRMELAEATADAVLLAQKGESFKLDDEYPNEKPALGRRRPSGH
jgi:hypothetical protein